MSEPAPLRIALVRQRYNPSGGAERFVEGALAALRGRGVRITLVTRRWPAGSTHDALVCNPFHIGSLWRDAGFARAACRALAARRFDLVQAHERLACCDVFRAGDGVHREWLAQRARAQGALARLGVRLNPYHRYTLAAERAMFASDRLRAVICNSTMVRDEIVRHYGVDERKLRVIRNGVDLDRFHPGLRGEHRRRMRAELGIPAAARVLAFVGSGFERKGLACALRALALAPTHWHLVVVGRDKHAGRYVALARGLGVDARVHFAGATDDVAPWYGMADAFVLPTLYDPFPNAAMEAFASGLPVLTSSKSGAAELVIEGVNGSVFDALDAPALARAIALFDDEARLAAASRAARAAVAAMTPQAMAAELVALYAELVG